MQNTGENIGMLKDLNSSLSILVKETTTLRETLHACLRMILVGTQHQSGAIFVTSSSMNDLPTWITSNLPDTWHTDLRDPAGKLNQIARVTINTREITYGNKEVSLAGAIPFIIQPALDAAILIYGQPCEVDEILEWQKLAEIISKIIRTKSIYQSYLEDITQPSQDPLTPLDLVETDSFSYDLQACALRCIINTVHAESGQLILIDSTNQHLAMRKIIQNNGQIKIIKEPRQYSGLAAKCIQTGRMLQVVVPDKETDLDLNYDSLDGSVPKGILYFPLFVSNQVMGAVEIINPQNVDLNPFEIGKLRTLINSATSFIFNNHLIQQLKIANADLESNRWELLHSRNTLRALFDNIPDSIYIVDQNYNLTAVNKSRAQRVNKPPNLLVGRKCYQALFDRESPCAMCLIQDTLFTGRYTQRIANYVDEEDQTTEWEISTFPIQSGNTPTDQVIVVEDDVTEKRRMEANLIQSEKLASVGQLAAGLAHEINNPLSAIIANAQLLQVDLAGANEDLLESVILIELASKRALQVVRNLLSFARKENYDFKPTQINDTIKDSISLLQHEIISHNINFVTDLQEDMPVIIASRDHLQGVWTNIIKNAIDAVEDSRGMITVTSRYEKHEFSVIIRDSGNGIPESRKNEIFEPFYTTKSSGRGTGLGLSVVHRIIKQHNGYIQVESELGVGTTFTVRLPEQS
jgi:two-component system NtrC family sensor kinase